MDALSVTPILPADLIGTLGAFDRTTIESFISVAIDMLDELDGDADAEDATNLEDDFRITDKALRIDAVGPGCPVSDADISVEDDPQGFDPEED